MEQATGTRISAGTAMRDGFTTLAKPPFRTLLLTGIIVSLVANTLPETADGATLIAALVLFVVGLYLQIATTVAAAVPDPDRSADVWLKEAWARRCFWRYVATSVLVMILVVVGLAGLVIGGFLVGGAVALADPAVVLERRGPADAIARSASLTKGRRPPLVVVFGLLVLLPGVALELGGLVWDLPRVAGDWWPLLPVVVLVLGMAGAIALTRIFLALGGGREPIEPKPDRIRHP